MGKIRVKTFEEASPEEEAKLRAKKEAKKAEKLKAQAAKNPTKVSKEEFEAKTEEIKSAEVETADTTGELKEASTPESVIASESESEAIYAETKSEEPTEKEAPKKKAKKEKFVKVKELGKRHKENLTHVSKSQSYSADQAIETLRKFKKSKFDETVELHVNVKEKGISGQVVLPHGTGKTLNIKVADEALIDEIAKGKITFDVLVATPQMMPMLAKVARILGPKGLMPNPKNGTVTNDTDETIKKLSGGQISYKTESAAPIIHVRVGKMSFEDKQLKENIKTFIGSIGENKINSVTLKSTMSPGISLSFSGTN